MPRIEGTPARSRLTSGAAGAVARKARARFARHLAARVVLRDELHIAVLKPPVFGLVLDAKIGQLQVPSDHCQILRLGEREPLVGRVRIGWPVSAVQELLVLALDFIVEDDPSHESALTRDLPRLFPEDAIQSSVVRELARFHNTGIEGLLPAIGSGGRVRVEKVFAVTREADDAVRALAIRQRRVRHETFLTEATPVAVKPVAAMLVCIEVTHIDDPKRAHCGECSRLRAVERVSPVSELDALALIATRQGQAVGEDVLVGLGPL